MHQIKKMKRSLDAIPGVLSVSANDKDGRVAVDYDSSGTDVSAIEKQLRGIGIDAELISNQNHIM
ncbi:cation transporter [Faecalispora anaeroviscerum]|uniref:cation transporter n=1 Tax=Faecalispora anaeroviscerum TaxID=2991836 RepID=UPI0024BB45D8|nr:heavy metal-associated domain-containing protein [Faecalispora anaeroviscerum]